METWRPLVDLALRHEFFADGDCRGLAAAETAATARVVRNHGLLVRTSPSAVRVFASDAAPVPDDPGLALVFVLRIRDRTFTACTDPAGASAGGTLRYDTTVPAAADETGSVLLAPVPDEAATGAMRDDVVLDAPDRRLAPFATVRVVLRPGDFATDAPLRRFAIRFGARRTHWKYYVLGYGDTQSPPTIRDSDGAVAFESAGLERLANDRQALTLRSTAPIALQERSAHRFQLRARTASGERVLVKRLAVASPLHLGKDTIDGREVTVSEIYINL